jgi:hypothetical protein
VNYQEYQKAFFTDPEPTQRFDFNWSFGVTLFFETFTKAVAYYTEVLGSPGYVEGAWTRGWRIGNGWLTILKGKSGNPANVEITLEVETVEQAEKLQSAFINAGGKGTPPSNQMMYVPIRACPVTDPFGTELLIICKLDK